MKGFRRGWQLPLLFGALWACGRALPEQLPPAGSVLYNPTALAISPDGSTGYIVNANFDQRYSAGWLSSFNVAALLTPPYSTASLQPQGRIPSLGSGITVSSDGLHAFVPHRGTGLVTILDMHSPNSAQLSCAQLGNTAAQPRAALLHSDCDDAHLLDLAAGMAAVAQAQDYAVNSYDVRDPAAIAYVPSSAASSTASVVVGFLSSGWLAQLSVPNTTISGSSSTVLQNYNLGPLMLNGLLWVPSSLTANLLLSSRVLPNTNAPQGALYTVDLATLPSGMAAQVGGPQAPSSDLSSSLTTQDVLAVAIAPDQTHIYATGRFPNALLVLQQSVVPQGSAQLGYSSLATLRVVNAVALGQARLNALLYVARASGDLLVASSVATDTLYFFAPQGDTVQLVNRLSLPAGQGPTALAYVQQAGQEVILATTFYDHGLTAVDISSPNPSNFNLLFEVHDPYAVPTASRYRR